jgi:hypothetical protein
MVSSSKKVNRTVLIVSAGKPMDDLQTLIEQIQYQTGSSVIDLRYRPDEDEPPWAVIIDWGNKYMSAVPGSIQSTPRDSLNAALSYLEEQKAGNVL